jgi:hypothetical protein
MITVQNMHQAITNFCAMQGVEIKQGGDKIRLRLVIPSEALNALMSDMNECSKPPTFKMDEQGLFYSKCGYQNVSLIIQEGKFYRLENVPGNQQMQLSGEILDILPGRSPNIDHKKPLQ